MRRLKEVVLECVCGCERDSEGDLMRANEALESVASKKVSGDVLAKEASRAATWGVYAHAGVAHRRVTPQQTLHDACRVIRAAVALAVRSEASRCREHLCIISRVRVRVRMMARLRLMAWLMARVTVVVIGGGN